MARGRPNGRYSNKTYIKVGSQILKPSKFKELVAAISKKETKKEVAKEIGHAGRPSSNIESLRVLGGSIRVKRAKSRTIKVNNKIVKVD